LAALDELCQVILEKNMKSMKRVAKTVGKLGLAGCAAISAPFAIAADSGWLVGANLGQSRAQIDEERITARLLQGGFTTTSFSDDDTDFAGKIFGGYKFNKYFALEGGYFNLGKFGYTATTTPAGSLIGNIQIEGLNFDAVGILPITEKFAAFGRVGVNYADVKDQFSSTGAAPTPTNPSPDEREFNYKAGLGLQYNFTKTVAMRAEWERYRINDAVGNDGDINMYSLGVVVMFGGSEPAPKAATAPAPVVAAPLIRTKDVYCSVLALTYEINADEIQRDDMERLGVLVTFMKKYPETTAVIEGHTDNVGTSQKNKELSQRRAQSVKSYLVNEQKITASRLTAVGYGEERPLADNSTEEGKRQNRRINAVITCATDFEGLKVNTAKTAVAMDIEFDPYKHEIQPEYRDGLRKVANFMKANPSVTATVEGHAGKYLGAKEITPKVSMEVSQQRAQAVVDHLVNNHGIARSRLSTVAFGQTRRTAYGTTLAGQQENRRVVIIFNYAK
jgi:OmpA-OmpF porin, OOP family